MLSAKDIVLTLIDHDTPVIEVQSKMRNVPKSTVRSAMQNLLKAGMIRRTRFGHYSRVA